MELKQALTEVLDHRNNAEGGREARLKMLEKYFGVNLATVESTIQRILMGELPGQPAPVIFRGAGIGGLYTATAARADAVLTC
jgi:hypothetical protein